MHVGGRMHATTEHHVSGMRHITRRHSHALQVDNKTGWQLAQEIVVDRVHARLFLSAGCMLTDELCLHTGM